MRMGPALGALLALLLPSAALAQGNLILDWNDCSTGGAKDQFFACDTNDGAPFVAYASIILPDTLPGVVTATFSFDLNVEGAWPVPWWQVSFGSCRSQSLDVPFGSWKLETSCLPLWNDVQTAGTFQIRDAERPGFEMQVYGGAAGSASHARPDGTEYVAIEMRIDRAHTVGPDACAGCSLGAEIVFDLCVLDQGGHGPTYVLTQPAWPGANRITWNAGPPVAAANRTWGAIKTLFR